MTRILLTALFLSTGLLVSQAHLNAPITAYLQMSGTVCIGKVTAIEKGEVTFTVEKVIKGNPAPILKLAPVAQEFAVGTEWLLAEGVDHGYAPNSVGWVLKGDCTWVDAPMQRADGKLRLVGNFGFVDPKLALDPSYGLSVDQIKALAASPLPKR